VNGAKVALRDLTAEAIESTVAEFDVLGREAFLAKYGYGEAKRYFLVIGSRRYDSKAVAGVACGHVNGQSALRNNEFSGGEQQVATRLRSLGFDVVAGSSTRNPTWSRDELILALDLYMQWNGNPPGKSSEPIVSLSRTLNRLSGSPASEDFRNANGVYMKIMNFRRFDPRYTGQGKVGLQRGGKEEESVWQDYADEPLRLHEVAEAISAFVDEGVRAQGDVDVEDDIGSHLEGRILVRVHQSRERSRKAVKDKKSWAMKTHGRLACEACDFDFSARYGDRGTGFIEVHHGIPLHTLKPGSKTKLSDLHLLCANCHRMIHAKRNWLTVEALKSLLLVG
jgi:5-methylcytosine-specific restriction enzyme A